MAPPHSRGSSLDRGFPSRPVIGSPALAGIIPTTTAGALPARRLPRTRGDHPMTRGPTPPKPGAPPHSRGSSLAPPPNEVPMSGSPALAGIILMHPRYSNAIFWLPRTRGDHPFLEFGTVSLTAAPPHSRGSSRGRMEVRALARGSPALAGIIPCSTCRSATRTWLPRTRGDHPQPINVTGREAEAPPHSRGSSPRQGRTSAARAGSPALAGIIPRRNNEDTI